MKRETGSMANALTEEPPAFGGQERTKIYPFLAQAGVNAPPGEKSSARFSAKKRKVSASPKYMRSRPLKAAETFSGLQVNVDDATLFDHIAAGRVGVHRNGSRQRKAGIAYDFRGQYRALRLNTGSREVLAFGTPERLIEKLAELGICVCFDHRRPVLTVGEICKSCSQSQEKAAF